MNGFAMIAYPLLPISAMELLLGFLLLSQSRRSDPLYRSVAAIAFFSAAYSLNTAVMYLMASHGYDFIFFARLNWIGWLAIPAGLQFLFCLRPETSRLARTAGRILYPYWALILALSLFTDLIVTPHYSLIPYRNDPGPLEIPARITGALMTLWLIVEIARTRRVLTGIKKFQLNYFFYGLLIFSFAGVAIAGLMPALKDFAVEPGLGAYFSLPWVGLTFYAIVRYSLFEMRIIVSRTLAIIILILAGSAMQIMFLAAVAPALGTGLSIFVSLTLLGFFLFGTPVAGKIRSLVDTIIIGKRTNFELLMREAMITLNTKKEGHELTDYLIATVCTGLGTRDAGVYLHRIEDGFVLREGRGVFQAMKNKRSLAEIAVKKLQETSRSLVLTEMAGAADDPNTVQVSSYLRGIEAEALVPIIFRGRLQGALVVGRKERGETLGQSDLGFLETLTAHAASALENARLNDITQTIRSSLRESEERFTTLAQKMPVAVVIYRDTSIIYANAAAEALTGYPCSRLTTMSIADLLHPEFPGAVETSDSRSTEPQMSCPANEVRLLQPDGAPRWALMTAAIIEYGERAAVLAILQDMTDHKRTEGKLRYERIRNAVERMGNLLSGYLEGLVKDLRSVASVDEKEELESGRAESGPKIQSAVERAELLIRTMKEFCSRPELKRSVQDINTLVASRKPVLTALVSGKWELIMRSSPVPLLVLADPVRIESMLINLVLNARDRMPRGGAITVATGPDVFDSDVVRYSGHAGTYASISVTDTGERLSAEDREQIFEPFFSTKGGVQVNGLGLSMAYETIREHDGYVTVKDGPEKTTSYIALLPLLQELI